MLPIILHPTFSATIPSTQKIIKLRPMLVLEEKILLMAKESDDPDDDKPKNMIMQAIKQIVGNCIVSQDVNVNKLTLFDIDYLFVQIRLNSSSSKVVVRFTDEDDPINETTGEKKLYEYEIDMNNVKIKTPKDIDKTIAVGTDAVVKLRYPCGDVYDSKIIIEATKSSDVVEELIRNCFDSYILGEKVYKFADATREEQEAFIDSMPIEAYDHVYDFFANMPHLHYELRYKNQQKEDKTLFLTRLSDFFTF